MRASQPELPPAPGRTVRWAGPLLAPLAAVYGGVIAARNFWYDQAGHSIDAQLPVISVGNLTSGGVGKSPLVLCVAQQLLGMGEKPAIVTRGYGARTGEIPDEVLEFRERLPGVAVVVEPNRRAGVAIAARDYAATCAVLDDGFQHRQLARDLDLVVIDALQPWGGRRLLPAGHLREPLTSLRRADALIVSRVNQASPEAYASICEVLQQYAASRPILRAEVSHRGVTRLNGRHEPLDSLGYQSLLPVCGIGNPQTFLNSVQEHAGHLSPPLIFRDHHRYSEHDVVRIADCARRGGAHAVITTLKDWVKLAVLWQAAAPHDLPLLRLDVALTLGEDAARLDELLLDALEARRGVRPHPA